MGKWSHLKLVPHSKRRRPYYTNCVWATCMFDIIQQQNKTLLSLTFPISLHTSFKKIHCRNTPQSGGETVLQTRNKNNAYLEALQYRQDLLGIFHYQKRTHFTNYTCCSESHNNTCAENRKIRGLKFDTPYWRHLAAQRKISSKPSPIKSLHKVLKISAA